MAIKTSSIDAVVEQTASMKINYSSNPFKMFWPELQAVGFAAGAFLASDMFFLDPAVWDLPQHRRTDYHVHRGITELVVLGEYFALKVYDTAKQGGNKVGGVLLAGLFTMYMSLPTVVAGITAVDKLTPYLPSLYDKVQELL